MCRWRRHIIHYLLIGGAQIPYKNTILSQKTESHSSHLKTIFGKWFIFVCVADWFFTMKLSSQWLQLNWGLDWVLNRYIFGRTFFKITFLRIHIYYVIVHFDILFSNWFFGVCSFTSAEKFLSSWKDSSQGTYVRLLETGSDITTSVLVLVLFICLVFFLLLHAFQVHWYQLYLFVCWRIVL